jgi:hypothetical protein
MPNVDDPATLLDVGPMVPGMLKHPPQVYFGELPVCDPL